MSFLENKTCIINKDLDHFKQLSQTNKQDLLSCHCLKSKETLTHIACQHGCDQILAWLIKVGGVNIEICNKDGKRPIHEAAQYSQEKCLQILLENKAQVDPLKIADWTPLMLACTKRNSNIVAALLKAGADASLKNKDGWNAFHLACREGDMDIIKLVHSHNPSASFTKSNNLRTPLHTAALHGHCDAVCWLLSGGLGKSYDKIDKDSCGVTPLMDAIRSGQIVTARHLLKQNFDLLTLQSLTPDFPELPDFTYVEAKSASKKVSFLLRIEDGMGRQAIHIAAQNGQLDALNFLLTDCGVDVDSTSQRTGETPLHLAALEGKLAVLERLLSLGADVNASDNKDRTALHKAVGGQHTKCVLALLAHGAVQSEDHGGVAPFHYARRQEIIEALKQFNTEIEDG